MFKEPDKRECLWHLALIELSKSEEARRRFYARNQFEMPEIGYKPYSEPIKTSFIGGNNFEKLLISLNRELPSKSELLNLNPRFREVLARLEKLGNFRTVRVSDKDFPYNLREDTSMHSVYARGNIGLSQESTVAVIGGKELPKETDENLETALSNLVREGFAIVSGIRKGLETFVHERILEIGGNAVGVLGNPLDFYWPEENKSLQNKIGEEHLLISPYPTCLGILWDNQFPEDFFKDIDYNVLHLADAVLIAGADKRRSIEIARSHCRKTGKKFWVLKEFSEKFPWARDLIFDKRFYGLMTLPEEEENSTAEY